MPDKHAILSASSSHRWLECPPSALLSASLPDSTSGYAQQGTDAHSLCEYKVNKALGRETTDPRSELRYLDSEMEECTDAYMEFVLEEVEKAKEKCKDPIVLVEQRLDFSRWVPDAFGTGDCVIVADESLAVIDMKYGEGVLVEAERNPQMMCYALGALELFDGIYDITEISMTVFQPRRSNVSTWTISKEELLEWANNTLSQIAALAAKGEGEFKAGNHCQFCRAKAICRKRAEYNLETAKYDFKMPDTLEDEEIEVILSRSDELVSWVTDVKDYALKEALNGKEWKDWKLVEGRAVRKYRDDDAVAEKVQSAGYDPYEHKVLGITAMTRMLGKSKFDELLTGLIEKPQGKPTLVPMSDKRPALSTAAKDFMEDK